MTAEVREVVTVFLRHDGEVLLVRRSHAVGTYRGRWSAISGYLEDAPLAQALTEIAEETGLDGDAVRLVRSGDPLEVSDPSLGIRWRIHPFLFDVEDRDAVRLDWENTELAWVSPEKIPGYPTVPSLAEAYERVCD